MTSKFDQILAGRSERLDERLATAAALEAKQKAWEAEKAEKKAKEDERKAEQAKARFRETALLSWRAAGNPEFEFNAAFERMWLQESQRRADTRLETTRRKLFRPKL